MTTLLEARTQPIEYITLSVDTSDIEIADRRMREFARAGGRIAKLGLEAQSAFGGPEGLSHVADEAGLEWVYDGKLKDIGNTMARAIENIKDYEHPPLGITMHADTSLNAMRLAQESAGDIAMLGVTLLTDISSKEALEDYGTPDEQDDVRLGLMTVEEAGTMVRRRVVMCRARKLAGAGVRGLVASAQELGVLGEDDLTQKSFKMIPGARSPHAQPDDQKNTDTPEEAIANGADLLVVGRQYLNSEDRPKELQLIVEEIAKGLEKRG